MTLAEIWSGTDFNFCKPRDCYDIVIDAINERRTFFAEIRGAAPSLLSRYGHVLARNYSNSDALTYLLSKVREICQWYWHEPSSRTVSDFIDDEYGETWLTASPFSMSNPAGMFVRMRTALRLCSCARREIGTGSGRINMESKGGSVNYYSVGSEPSSAALKAKLPYMWTNVDGNSPRPPDDPYDSGEGYIVDVLYGSMGAPGMYLDGSYQHSAQNPTTYNPYGAASLIAEVGVFPENMFFASVFSHTIKVIGTLAAEGILDTFGTLDGSAGEIVNYPAFQVSSGETPDVNARITKPAGYYERDLHVYSDSPSYFPVWTAEFSPWTDTEYTEEFPPITNYSGTCKRGFHLDNPSALFTATGFQFQ